MNWGRGVGGIMMIVFCCLGRIPAAWLPLCLRPGSPRGQSNNCPVAALRPLPLPPRPSVSGTNAGGQTNLVSRDGIWSIAPKYHLLRNKSYHHLPPPRSTRERVSLAWLQEARAPSTCSLDSVLRLVKSRHFCSLGPGYIWQLSKSGAPVGGECVAGSAYLPFAFVRA